MSGVELIRKERRRQVTEEKWSRSHDDTHRNDEMAAAAACYAAGNMFLQVTGPNPRWSDHCANTQPRFRTFHIWPQGWHYKPTSRIRMLVKAGALIAAEIDRLQRLDAP